MGYTTGPAAAIVRNSPTHAMLSHGKEGALYHTVQPVERTLEEGESSLSLTVGIVIVNENVTTTAVAQSKIFPASAGSGTPALKAAVIPVVNSRLLCAAKQ